MVSVPDDLMYSHTHEWVRTEEGVVVIGITDYAQEQLGEVVYVELPEVGRSVDVGEEIGTLESVKAVSEVVSPVAGEVIAINDQLGSEPNLVNEEPYGDGWLVKISGSADDELLDGAAYQQLCAEEKESH